MIKFLTTWKSSPKQCIFDDFLLLVGFIQDALRKELLIASFIELFKNLKLKHCISAKFLLIQS